MGGDVNKSLDLFEALLFESQIRGRHATGVSYVSQDKIRSVKMPVSAEAFLESEQWLGVKQLRPTSLMGHCRYSTSGDWHDNRNNQPLHTSSLALVHNGIISMATKAEFEAKFKCSCNSYNDSEIILQQVVDSIQDLGTNQEPCELEDGIHAALARISQVQTPVYALAMMDKTGSICISRDNIRPLWGLYHPNSGTMGFASTHDIIKRAAKRLKIVEEITCWKFDPWKIHTFTDNGIKKRKVLNLSANRYRPAQTSFPRSEMIDHSINANAQATLRGKDLDLDSPTYEDGDHRLDTRESFVRYSAAACLTWEIDPNYPLMAYLFDRYELSQSQQYWACYLYGVFYHPGTVFYVMQEFPDYELIDLERLKRWHEQHWQHLRYNKDRKYEKGHLVEMFESYVSVIGSQAFGSQEGFFESLIVESPTSTFHGVFRALMKLLRFGRYAVYIYTECLARAMGFPMSADTIFLKEADSSRAGLCYALGKPDWAKKKLTREEWDWLEEESEKLQQEVRENYYTTGLNFDSWLYESCLCSYKGFFATGRYLGYYLDRMADEILQMSESPITEGVDWSVLWQFRRESFMYEYLGEYAKPKRLKVQKQWKHVLKDTGHMIGLWPLVKRGLLPNNAIPTPEGEHKYGAVFDAPNEEK